jgi:hypothetical protein
MLQQELDLPKKGCFQIQDKFLGNIEKLEKSKTFSKKLQIKIFKNGKSCMAGLVLAVL